MYITSEAASAALNKIGGRKFNARVKIGTTYYDCIREAFITKDTPKDVTLGNTISKVANIKMNDIGIKVYNQEFELEYGITLEDGSIEYIPMGKYIAEKPTVDSNVISFKGNDRMIKAEGLYISKLTGYPRMMYDVLKEACDMCGIPWTKDVTLRGQINEPPKGYTYREIIGYIAAYNGKNAYIDRNGNLKLSWFGKTTKTYGASSIYSWKPNEGKFVVYSLTCNVDKQTQKKAGSGDGITYDDPFDTDSNVTTNFNQLKNSSWSTGELTILGDPRIDDWDVITLNLSENYDVPAMYLQHKFDGGVVTTIKAVGNSTATEKKYQGPVTKTMDRMYSELIMVNSLVASKASITELETAKGRITDLEATRATIDELNLAKGRIKTIENDYLTSKSAVIGTLTSGYANINNLLTGNVEVSGTINANFANALVSVIGDAAIKSAMIESIDANQITAGVLLTNKVSIESQNGRLTISGDDIILKDTSYKTRIKIGLISEELGYDFNLFDADGKLMFSAAGLSEDAIKEAIINNDAVMDNANISAGKLNIESLFDVINSDDTKYTFKSTKIYLDDKEQTLDVAFKSMSGTVDDISGTVSTQGTDISIIQGKISNKIWQTDITNSIDEYNKGINARFSETNQTIEGFETLVLDNMNINNLLVFPYYYNHDLLPNIVRRCDGYDECVINGVTWKVYPNGRVVANGTANGDSNFYCSARMSSVSEWVGLTYEPGVYMLHGCPEGGSYSKYYMWGNVTRDSESPAIFTYDTGKGVSGTILEGDTTVGIYCTIHSGYTANDIEFYPMVEKGSVKHKYTEYGKSLPSVYSQAKQNADKFSWLVAAGSSQTFLQLTPVALSAIAENINLNGKVNFNSFDNDTKTIINSIQDTADGAYEMADDATKSIIVDNLIELPYYNSNGATISGVKFTYGEDGVITANGTATANASFYIKTRQQGWKPKAGYYTLSGCPGGGSATTFYVYGTYGDSGARFGNDSDYGSGLTAYLPDISSNTYGLGLYIIITKGYTCNNIVFKPMFETGTVKHTYQPRYLARDYVLVPDTTTIDGGKIAAKSIKAESIDVNTLDAITFNGKEMPIYVYPTTDDALKIRKILYGYEQATQAEMDYYDFNADGKLDTWDFVYARMLATGYMTIDEVMQTYPAYKKPMGKQKITISTENQDAIKIESENPLGVRSTTIVRAGIIHTNKITSNGGQDVVTYEKTTEAYYTVFKYSDGTMRIIYKKQLTTDITNAGGGIYWGYVDFEDFPVPFKNEPTVVMSASGTAGQGNNCWTMGANSPSVTNAGGAYVLRETPATNSTFIIQFIAEGEWK